MPFCNVILSSAKPVSSSYPREVITLGDRLKKRRLDLKLQKMEVARMLNVDFHTIARWENNETWPLPQSITKIREFLGDAYSDEISKMSLGERIFRYRKTRNLTLRQLAKQLDVTATTISSWERDKNKPRKKQRKRLREMLA